MRRLSSSNPFVQFSELEKGDVIRGVVQSRRKTGEYGNLAYTIVLDKPVLDFKAGDTVSVNECATLRELQQVEDGTLVELVYKGLGVKKAGQKAPFIFECFADDEQDEPKQTVIG